VNGSGKVVGYDMLYIKLVSSTSANLHITVDVNGGMLYGTAKLNSKGMVVDGKVTGGTGAFAHAAGTLAVRTVNKAGTRHAVKITYRT
jgi:hypothetical protein